MPRKVNIGFHPGFMQRNWLAIVKAKEAEVTKQAPTPAQPDEVLAAESSDAQSSDIQPPKYCTTCTPTGNISPNQYPIAMTADWPDDSEEEKETQEQNKDKNNFSDIEDWAGDLEKQKNSDNQTLQPSPESTSTSETFTPHPSKPFVDRFGNQISVSSEEGHKEETFEDSLEDIDLEVCMRNSVYDS